MAESRNGRPPPAGAFAVDMVRFSLAPGRYRLDVAVVDSVSGRRTDTAVELEGFATAPQASDLLCHRRSGRRRAVTPCPDRRS